MQQIKFFSAASLKNIKIHLIRHSYSPLSDKEVFLKNVN